MSGLGFGLGLWTFIHTHTHTYSQDGCIESFTSFELSSWGKLRASEGNGKEEGVACARLGKFPEGQICTGKLPLTLAHTLAVRLWVRIVLQHWYRGRFVLCIWNSMIKPDTLVRTGWPRSLSLSLSLSLYPGPPADSSRLYVFVKVHFLGLKFQVEHHHPGISIRLLRNRHH